MATPEKDIRKLGRAELLELLIMQTEENERLSARIDELEGVIGDRRIDIESSGSIAEAALKLNKVFESAQAAAEEYIESVKEKYRFDESESARVRRNAEAEAEAIIAEARAEAESILSTARRTQSETEAKCRAMEKETERRCEETERLARKTSDEYWEAVMSAMSIGGADGKHNEEQS